MSKSRNSRGAQAAIVAVAAAWLAAGSVSAHHSPAPFDLRRTDTLEGTVTRYHWANPHVYIDVEVEAEDGSVNVWEVEAAWPASLAPMGWSSDTSKPGDCVAITGNPGRNRG